MVVSSLVNVNVIVCAVFRYRQAEDDMLCY